MARQTSLEVTTPELTFFFSSVAVIPRQYWLCLAYSIWLRTGSMKSTVFRFANNIWPEMINTDQIHAYAI